MMKIWNEIERIENLLEDEMTYKTMEQENKFIFHTLITLGGEDTKDKNELVYLYNTCQNLKSDILKYDYIMTFTEDEELHSECYLCCEFSMELLGLYQELLEDLEEKTGIDTEYNYVDNSIMFDIVDEYRSNERKFR